VFGVTADSSAEIKYFQCPRYVGNNLDLTGCFVRMNYRNANGEVDSYLVEDLTVDGNNVLFSWVLSPKVTMYKGNVSFVMCVVGPDTKVKWHTTLGRGQVLEGLEPDSAIVEEGTADVVAALITMVEAQTEAVEAEGGKQIEAVQDAAKTAESDAVAQIEAKGASTLATIPEEYTAVQSAVRGAANAIRKKVSGEVIRVDDVSPMEHYPVVKVSGKNILPYPYKQTTATASGGTFTAQPDGGVLVSGVPTDHTSLNLYQDVPLAKSGNIILSFSGNFANVNISMVIYDATDTVLFTKETWQGASPISVNLDLYPTATRWLVFLKRGTPNIEMSGVVYPQMEFGDTATAYTPYIDPTTVTVRRCGKNLLPMATAQGTGNGITFAVNDDGSVIVNGTATKNAAYNFITDQVLPAGKYRLSGCPAGGSVNTYRMQANKTKDGVSTSGAIDQGTGATLTVEEGDLITVYLVVLNGQTASNLRFYPMLRFYEDDDKYEPGNVATHIPSPDGMVSGLTAVSPTMTLLTDKVGVNIECEYNRDTNKVIAEILEKITALGG
jgi:hypothetical protein